jgi:hypothetical protein
MFLFFTNHDKDNFLVTKQKSSIWRDMNDYKNYKNNKNNNEPQLCHVESLLYKIMKLESKRFMYYPLYNRFGA